MNVLFIVASFILKEMKSNNSEVAVLMCLLLFDEIACIETWLVHIFLTIHWNNTFSCIKVTYQGFSVNYLKQILNIVWHLYMASTFNGQFFFFLQLLLIIIYSRKMQHFHKQASIILVKTWNDSWISKI